MAQFATVIIPQICVKGAMGNFLTCLSTTLEKCDTLGHIDMGHDCGASLSEEAPWRGPQGELLHWGPWKMSRKFPDAGISLHGGPFPPEGNLVCGGGLIYQGL